MKILAVLIGVLAVATILVWLMILVQMRRLLRAGAKRAIEKAWKRVGDQDNLTLKIVEADKILDEALRLLGYSGTLGEKLKAAGPRFSHVDGVWKAHKLRNTLVHELDKKPSEAEVKNALMSFQRALRDLGARIE